MLFGPLREEMSGRKATRGSAPVRFESSLPQQGKKVPLATQPIGRTRKRYKSVQGNSTATCNLADRTNKEKIIKKVYMKYERRSPLVERNDTTTRKPTKACMVCKKEPS
jgi:hypothetical protein